MSLIIYGCSIITYTLHKCKESVLWDCINLQCTVNSNNPQSVLSTSLVHQSGAAGYKVRRRWSKHKSERGNAKTKSTLRNVQPFAIDVKGGGKAGNSRKGLLKEARQRKSWRKHCIIGGCVAINAKGGGCWKCYD